MSIIKATDMQLNSFFSSGKYLIPQYQRGYSWGKVELEDLWDDVVSLLEFDSEFDHFLGQIVIHSEKNDKYIIDGQQRITTITILLSVLRDMYQKFLINLSLNSEVSGPEKNELLASAKDAADDITTKFIGKKNSRSNTLVLTLGKTGEDYFKLNVQDYDDVTPRKLTKGINIAERNILNAIKFYQSKVEDYLDFSNPPTKIIDKLDILLKVITNNIVISYIETDDQNQAFIIFETLNARGSSLATSDLLKNHVIRSVQEEAREGIIDSWDYMVDSLETIEPTKYIRSFWNSREPFSRDKTLYKRLRSKYSTSTRIEKLVNSLLDQCSVYKSLVNPTINPLDSLEINKRLIDLKTISATTYYPLYLTIDSRNDFTKEDKIKVLDHIISYYVRNIVVAGQVANRTEIFFADLANKVFNHHSLDADFICSEISKETIDDETFANSFEKFTSKTTPQIRYLLVEIENRNNLEKIVDIDAIHVEHIMPKSNEVWKYDTAMHEDNLNRFGNLTILGSEYNIQASNALFEDKKPYYDKSKIDLTRELIDIESWGVEEIAKRQKRLASLALKVW